MNNTTAVAAERSVLGGILISCDVAPPALDVLSPGHFVDARHAVVFAAILSLRDRDEPVDVITVLGELKSNAGPPKLGWAAYIAELADSTATAATVDHHAEVVRKEARRRDFVSVMDVALPNARLDGADADEILTEAITKLGRIAEGHASLRPTPMRDLAREEFRDIQNRGQSGDLIGLQTGFPSLDNVLCGLVGGNLIVVAARPSMGKSSFVRNILAHLAIRRHKRGLLFSLEMQNSEIVMAMFASEAQVDLQRIRTGRLCDREWPLIVEASNRLYTDRIALVDRPALSVAEIRSTSRQYASRHQLDVVVVDYLQLATGRGTNREQEVADISRGLKALAKELDIPVIAVSQLNRSVESRANKRPMLSDLRESGSIEQDSDVVLFIYRDEYYNATTKEPGVAEIGIAKNRNGPTGMIKLQWSGRYTRFGSAESQTDIPFGDEEAA